MDSIFKEIKNWHLFTETFGDEYTMHDAVIKRFDLNEDVLIVVVNTLYAVVDEKVYDVTFKFSHLISIDSNASMGNDYIWQINVEKDKHFKNLFKFTFEEAHVEIQCFDIEIESITEAEPFQRGMICLDKEDVTPDSSNTMWRS